MFQELCPLTNDVHSWVCCNRRKTSWVETCSVTPWGFESANGWPWRASAAHETVRWFPGFCRWWTVFHFRISSLTQCHDSKQTGEELSYGSLSGVMMGVGGSNLALIWLNWPVITESPLCDQLWSGKSWVGQFVTVHQSSAKDFSQDKTLGIFVGSFLLGGAVFGCPFLHFALMARDFRTLFCHPGLVPEWSFWIVCEWTNWVITSRLRRWRRVTDSSLKAFLLQQRMTCSFENRMCFL